MADSEGYSHYEEFDDFIVDDGKYASGDVGSRPRQESKEGQDTEEDEQHEEHLDARLMDFHASHNASRPNPITVSPEQQLIKAHISVLVTALGGPDHTSTETPPPYKLGLDALACLKDIKRWIRAVDEAKHAYDVALACHESKLMVDLVSITSQWERQAATKTVRSPKQMERIIIACLELMVLLTWPLVYDNDLSPLQKLQFSAMKKAQLADKKLILQYGMGLTLKAMIRLVLPIMSKDRFDRDNKDNALVRLVLFLIRNILFIQPGHSSLGTKNDNRTVLDDLLPENVSLEEISMNTVIPTFKKNKVFLFLLTMTTALGSDFNKQMFGPISLECIYLLTRGIRPSDLIRKQVGVPKSKPTRVDASELDPKVVPSSSSTALMELKDLLNAESKKKQIQSQFLSTRHGRFGSLVSLRNDQNVTSMVISGQEALYSSAAALDRLDKAKSWKIPSRVKYDSDDYVSGTITYVNVTSSALLQLFVDDLLAAGCINNLIYSVASVLSSLLETTLPYDRAVYFLTQSWFLKYKRDRNSLPDDQLLILFSDSKGFGSIGSVLGDLNFRLMVQYFQDACSSRDWNSIHVFLVCFNEFLLVAHTLFNQKTPATEQTLFTEEEDDDSSAEVEKEMAEVIVRKLFASSIFLDDLARIPETAAKHSPSYLRKTMEVVDVIFKTFESFSNQDVQIYIKSVKKHKLAAHSEFDGEFDEELDEIEASRKAIRNRKLDFVVFQRKFFRKTTISSYISFLSLYEDLSVEEIKMALTFFHRLFVVHRDYISLIRLDFMYLLKKLSNYLPKKSSIKSQVDDFIYYFMKKFKGIFQRFPVPIELLFPEIYVYSHYLNTGEIPDSSPPPEKATSRYFADDTLSMDFKLKVLANALYDEGKERQVNWLITEFKRIVEQTGEAGESKINVKSKFAKDWLYSNSTLRLLLTELGFNIAQTYEDSEDAYSCVNVQELLSKVDLFVSHWTVVPGVFEEDKEAHDYFEVDRATSNDAGYSSTYAERSERNQRTERPDKLRKLRRTAPLTDDSILSDSHQHRPTKEFQSAEFINDTDDESDEERDQQFFDREEKLRNALSNFNTGSIEAFRDMWKSLLLGSTVISEAQTADILDSNNKILESLGSQNHTIVDTDIEPQPGDEPPVLESHFQHKKRKRIVLDDEDDE
ncbi:Topoisomerase 1-associated factor 1 [Scheffersomyces spartinae]|uniref:Topoisomerase 1-associated factor 1 n=1 Tax=Scheffersomyces spartinae TaxID=45513 RepID=A0A9P7V877_9ASCO|nr:Topoisomerase 1-associated factor 1 [Scheffersomyces spartinae]KAG7192858.1 Topoisomerase 1-associated factor 1 [Scheffersomyces spartinae]